MDSGINMRLGSRGIAVALTCVLAILAGAGDLAAQQNGQIHGRVVDEQTGQGLAVAQVYIPETGIGTLTDTEGYYTLRQVPPGTHQIVVQLLGYARKTVTGVTVEGRKTAELNVALPPQAIELEELTVSVQAERGNTAALLLERKKSAQVVDAIGSEQISRSPDGDAAALKRVPGLSVVDGKYVYVRGLGERYGSTTLNGAPLPSPESDRKAIPLDIIPSSFLESVSTAKTYLPDQPGDYAGGGQQSDDSGTLTYVRIEYVGFEVSFGNELNGLTLNGVGSGTELHHIQSHYGLDDGIEFFGGTVDLQYAIVTGASDDSFDYSTGWQGRGQFWIAQQDPADADNGFEVDGNEEDFDAVPLTNPTIYNVTLVGGGDDAAAGESTRGLLLRRGTGGHIFNAIVIGFGEAGLDVDNDETVTRIDDGDFMVANSIFFDNASNFEADDDGIDEAAIGMTAAWNNRTEDPGLADPYNREAPDFRPTAGSAAATGFATPPDDGFFEDVDFVGGVSPDGTPWYDGWITLDQS